MSTIPGFEVDLVMTEAEYLAFEDRAETKHEFVDGHVYDWPAYEVAPSGLAGASRTHNRLQMRLVRALGPLADAAGCDVLGSDMRLRIRQSGTRRYYYPDVMVIGEQELAEGDDEMHVTRPCIVVEILSRRSARIDHTEKLQAYRAMPSVQAYVIVHQQQRRVERHWRAGHTWHTESIVERGVVSLACVNAELNLDDVYGLTVHAD